LHAALIADRPARGANRPRSADGAEFSAVATSRSAHFRVFCPELQPHDIRHAARFSLASPSPEPCGEAPPSVAAAAPDPNKAEGRFKNIQVLKGYPADDVFPAMQFISAALGVDCEFCHVEHAPEKDDKKEKQTARKMITMTMAINRENFDGHREVTCMSCHHGASHPVAIPLIAADEPKPEAAAPKAADLPNASAVLDKYTQAVGGAEALAKIETRVQKGKLTGFGPEPVPVEVSAKAPDKRITIVHGQRGDNITAFDGVTGWLGNAGRPPRDMSPAESDAARLDATLLFPSDLTRLFKEFKVASVDKIDGKDPSCGEERQPRPCWFDAESGSSCVMRAGNAARPQPHPIGANCRAAGGQIPPR
jgi:hypothetical protein